MTGKQTFIRPSAVFGLSALIAATPAWAGDEDERVLMDEVSVTATRAERATKEVPSSIAVIGKEKIEANKMFNIKEALQGTPGVLIDSKNGGYSSRLIIRGAGQKANYGVREIMVLRDGVPMTDPDSFTRFDFIDTQDIERIEVTKGPGSIYGSGAAGGTIQILSKSVFDEAANRARVMGGTSETSNAHVRYGSMIGEDQAVALTFSRRAQGNNWRRWNEFESSQASIKHGYMFDDGATWESELSFSAANLQLPGSMNVAQFNDYRENGKQMGTKDAWKHSGRDSKIVFLNTRLEKEWGDFNFKPRLYFNHWQHFHPVTGAINDSPHNLVYGVDLEAGHQHKGRVAGKVVPGELVAGLTVRQDNSIGAKKYKYRDVTTGFGGRISETLSDARGALIEEEDAINTIYGLYARESLRPVDGLLIDLGLRYDRSEFNIDQDQPEEYDFSSGTYVTGGGFSETDKGFDLWSPSLGASYALTDTLNVYGSFAQSDQVPSMGELQSNTALTPATARSFEIGLKGRDKRWSFDATAYHTLVTDDIISTVENNETKFANAGETLKRGFEFAGEVELLKGLRLGATYAYSNYKFVEFQESVSDVNQNRAGKSIPYVPMHQYGINLSYRHSSGLKARVQSDTWGKYYLDNANSESHIGYEFLTNVMVGYERGPHSLSFNIENLLDQRYATEVKKDTRGTKSHSAGQPRTFLLTYSYKF